MGCMLPEAHKAYIFSGKLVFQDPSCEVLFVGRLLTEPAEPDSVEKP